MDLTGTYDANTPAGLLTVTLRVASGGRLEGELRAGTSALRLAGMADGHRGEGTATNDLGAQVVFQVETVGRPTRDPAGRPRDRRHRRGGAPAARRAGCADAQSGGAGFSHGGDTCSTRGGRADGAVRRARLPGWDLGWTRGRMRVDGEGSVYAEGRQLRWAIDGDMVVLTGPGGSARVGYHLDSDQLRFTANGQTETFTRVNLDDPMQTLAGVWVATESHVDPSLAMIITQYVTLYADGAASFEKTEGGASRTRVSEHLMRFSSFHQAGPRSVNGRWRSDGMNLELQWSWRNAPVVGRVNGAAGKLVLDNVGILNEGAPLTYERQ